LIRMRNLSDFTVVALKRVLEERGYSSAGTKAELIIRVMEADPSGEWLRDEGAGSEVSDQHGNVEGASQTSARPNLDVQQKEIEIYRREKELAERELELMRRELELVRRGQMPQEGENAVGGGTRQRVVNDDDDVRGQSANARVNITAIADLLSYFDGKSATYDIWEKQIRLLKATYRLEDDAARLIIGMRLKGKALEWLHSKPEYVGMPFDSLLRELQSMFHRRQTKVTMRKKFEERIWKKDETFHEYYEALRNQARVQGFETVDTLLRGFEKVTFRERGMSNTSKHNNNRNNSKGEKKENKVGDNNKKNIAIHCHNCGMRDHLGINCPTKEQGVKCFECNERGHIASKCPRKIEGTKRSYAATRPIKRRYVKDVVVGEQQIKALIDSGSDLTMMRADEYVKLGSPCFRPGGLFCNFLRYKSSNEVCVIS
ncbi:hypothetical protein ALC62_03005, partial [Cyphomyrmex costatus]